MTRAPYNRRVLSGCKNKTLLKQFYFKNEIFTHNYKNKHILFLVSRSNHSADYANGCGRKNAIRIIKMLVKLIVNKMYSQNFWKSRRSSAEHSLNTSSQVTTSLIQLLCLLLTSLSCILILSLNLRHRVGIVQSVPSLITWRTRKEQGLDSLQVQKILLFAEQPKPFPESTQPPTQYVRGSFSSWVKQ